MNTIRTWSIAQKHLVPLLAVVATLCAQGSTADAMVGGVNVGPISTKGRYRHGENRMVRLMIEPAETCTGSIIGASTRKKRLLILTAAHCLADGHDPTNIRMKTITVEFLATQRKRLLSSDIVQQQVFPAWRSTAQNKGYTAASQNGTDVGVLVVKGSLPKGYATMPLLPLQSSPSFSLVRPKEISILGVGYSRSNPNDELRRLPAKIKKVCTRAGPCGGDAGTLTNMVRSNGVTVGDGCSGGDSGGAATVSLQGKPYQIGVNAVEDHGRSETEIDNYTTLSGTRIIPILNWIRSVSQGVKFQVCDVQRGSSKPTCKDYSDREVPPPPPGTLTTGDNGGEGELNTLVDQVLEDIRAR